MKSRSVVTRELRSGIVDMRVRSRFCLLENGNYFTSSLTEFSHDGVLSYPGHEQNYLLVKGNLKIGVYKDSKTLKT